MIRFLLSIFDDHGADLRRKTVALYTLLVVANGVVWLWAWLALHGQPVLFGSAMLAYTLGLRHAVDADHIAAIDNVTRKLVREGRRPITAGFFFSLGHSSVVTLMSVAVAVATVALQSHFDALKNIGSVVGTSVSAFYLFLLGGFNLVVLVSVWRTFHAVRRGAALHDGELDLLLNQRGLLARLFQPLFRLTSRSWHMYPMGFLFGLGFDTATEVALFGIAAAEAGKGLSFWSIMVFPALFTAGMSLVDTADSTLMQGAYGWAATKPLRKLLYNFTVTLVSVLVALGVAGIETLGLLRERFHLAGEAWDLVGRLNDNFGLLGYGIIGLFVVCWLVSLALYKLKRYDELDATLVR